MNKDIIRELAVDILFHTAEEGKSSREALDLAEALLSDRDWEIRYIGGEATCNENGCFVAGCCEGDSPPVSSKQDAAEAALTTADIDEIAQRVVALLKERL